MRLSSERLISLQESFDKQREIDTINKFFIALYSPYDIAMEDENEYETMMNEWQLYIDILTKLLVKIGFVITLNSSGRYQCVDIIKEHIFSVNFETVLNELGPLVETELTKTEAYQDVLAKRPNLFSCYLLED